MSDIRSNKCVFVSHCVLAQFTMANGLVKKFPSIIKPVILFCLENDINIIQMPCPETLCPAGGLGRTPHGKEWYEGNGLREVASSIASEQVAYMQRLLDANNEVLAIIGVDFSPACGINYLNKGPIIYKDQGIYIEELKNHMAKVNIEIPFIGINQRAHKKLARQLREMLTGMLGQENKPLESSDDNNSSGGQLSLFESN